jgi:hypothetical protein
MPEPARYVPRWIYEGAGDMAREIAKSWEGRTSRRLGKKIEMLFAHLKRILKLDRLCLRAPNRPRDEFILAATAQNLRQMAKLIPMPSLRSRIGTAKPMLVPQTGHRCPAFCRKPEAHLFSTEACSIALSWD